MATIVAAAGGGNWTSGGTWVGGVAPTAADDVQLTNTSGNVTIDTGAVCRSLNCTGYTGTLTHGAAVNFNIGDGTAGASNIALKLVSGMTYSQSGNGSIGFVSTSATQQTITTAGKTIVAPNVAGTGSSYVLGDAMTANSFTLTAGTFNTGSFACSWSTLTIVGAGAKTLTLGSSAVSITANSATAVNVTGSNITFTANTATTTFSGAAAGLVGAFNWNGMSVVFSSTVTDARLVTGPTVANVTYTNGANKTSQFTIQGGNATITGTLTLTGNSTVNRIWMRTELIGTSRTVTVGTSVSLSNVDFIDITAAGAAGTWSGTSMGNCLGNSNITFDTPATQTRSGAGGNWSTAGNWTSRVPLPQDNVVINASASGTITGDMPRIGADIDFTGFTGTYNATVASSLYGSLTYASGMTVSGTPTLVLGARSSNTITTNGKTVTQGLRFNAPGGTYTLQDALTASAAIGIGVDVNNASVPGGTFNTNNFAVTCSAVIDIRHASTTINLGTSTVTLNEVAATTIWSVGAAVVFNGASATFVVGTASANARVFGGAGQTYGTLTYTVTGSTGSLQIFGSNTFSTINFSDASNARSLLFIAGTTTAATNWNVVGTAGKLMTIDSTTAATHTLSKSGGIVATDYLFVKNSVAQGGATWYAGANSTNQGGNSGWKFTGPNTGWSGFFS